MSVKIMDKWQIIKPLVSPGMILMDQIKQFKEENEAPGQQKTVIFVSLSGQSKILNKSVFVKPWTFTTELQKYRFMMLTELIKNYKLK